MRATAVGFSVPKAGRTPAENEDAFHDDGPRFAVADGATESSYAKKWAELIVQAVGDCSPLALAQIKWQSGIPKNLPWYAVENSERGAFAAFLVLEIDLSRTWSAWSIGDCCLFQVRDGRLHRSWPFTDPKEFNNHPFLIGSRSTEESLENRLARFESDWEPGDEFWLATDALAHWLLSQNCDGQWSPVGLPNVSKDEVFHNWVEARRHEGLRNDDTTLVRVTLS